MKLKGTSRGLALALVCVAIVGAVLLLAAPWATRTDKPVVQTSLPSVQLPSQEPMAASAEASEMLKLTRAAFAACGVPAPPTEVPDGVAATREQMLAAHATVRAFDEATTIYTRCIDTTAYQAGVQFKAVATSADTDALGALQTQLHNAAIDRDQAVANRFNVQLRRFKARAEK
jgi:hypothetical protein